MLNTFDISPCADELLALLRDYRRQDIYRALACLTRAEDFPPDDLAALTEMLRTRLRRARAASPQARASPYVQGFGGADPKVDLPFDAQVWALSLLDEGYPEVLRAAPDPPLVLWGVGAREALAQPRGIAIVGARRATTRGRIVAQDIAQEVVRRGLCVVSGLAYGIDAAAHEGALRGQGTTLAVLGAGLCHLYPRRHTGLAERIVAAGGALITEYGPGQAPRPYQFPERNRIVSGISTAVVVVEAGDKSGSLITARLALEQGRDVFALPGPVDSLVSAGCHRLIQQGAGLVTGAQDLCTTLGLGPAASRASVPSDLDPDAARVLAVMSLEPMTTDDIQSETKLDTAALLVILSQLEMQGFVQHRVNGYIAALKLLED